jgi:hypothetical protein
MNKPYKLPSDYLTWKEFEAHSQLMAMVSPRQPMANDYAHENVGRFLSNLYSEQAKGYPIYCVRKSLLDDMCKTDVGDNLALFADIKLAIPTYTLFFPKKTIKSPFIKEGYIDYLIVCHSEVNYMPEYQHFIYWGCIDSNGSLIFSSKRIRTDGTLKSSYFSEDSSEEQQLRALNIRNIVLQSILLLQYYPEIVGEVAQDPLKGFAKPNSILPGKEYLLPRWLGKERVPSGKTEGTGSSKSPHFRRGFWRVQPCGVGRTENRNIWVSPTWVNSEESDS